MENKKLPKEWEWKKLSEVTESISSGGTPRRNVKEYWENGDIPWLKISDIKNTYVNSSEEKITKLGLDKSSAKLFPKGTIVYSIFATLGEVSILNITATTNQAIAGITPNNKIVDTKYLYYCLKSQKENIIQKKSHATQDNLNLTILKNHEFPIPTLLMQKKIVEILEKAEDIKQRKDKMNSEVKKIILSYFIKLFGTPFINEHNFEVKPIGEVIEDCKYGLSKKSSEKGYCLIGMNSINYDGGSNFEKCSHVELDDKEFNKFKLEKGDILFNRTNAPNLVGKTGIFNLENESYVYASYIIRLRVKKEVMVPEFLWMYLNTPQVKNKLFSMCKRAVSQANINAQELKSIEVYLPNIDLQKKFMELANSISCIKKIQDISSKEINNLFDGLMQKAFIGTLIK